MPHIKEDDLVNLYHEIDKLKVDKKDLQEGYVDLKLKSNEIKKQNVIYKVASLILLLICICFAVFWYTNNQKTLKLIENKEAKEIQLLDSIETIAASSQPKVISNADFDKLVYLVQIGNYKKIDLFNESKKMSNFQQVNTPKYNTYLMGGFTTYKEAKKFKNDLRRFGIRDAFLVAYNKQKRIDIREALKLSNETQYLK